MHIPKLLYPPGHLYRGSTIGSHDTITNITLADVQRYVDENYRPEYSTIAVVGDFALEGGQGMGMVFEAFEGVEHLLMAPEDAEAYEKIEDAEARIQFLNEWVPRLAEFIRTEGAEPPKPRVDCSAKVEPPASTSSVSDWRALTTMSFDKDDWDLLANMGNTPRNAVDINGAATPRTRAAASACRARRARVV